MIKYYLGGNRPRWAESVRWWLVDGQYDRLMELPDEHWRWKLGDAVERVGVRGLCLLLGHEVADDMCHKPEPRFCVFCNRPMANLPCGLQSRRTL